jgi:hypothetical protein
MLPNNNPFNFFQNSGALPAAGPYGNTFLNDVHRIFPAFLYNGSRFQTMGDVFRYIERQMSIHYNVYNNAQNEYIMTQDVISEQSRSLQEIMNHIIHQTIPEGNTGRQGTMYMRYNVATSGQHPQRNISTAMDASMNTFISTALQDFRVGGSPFETCSICQSDINSNAQATQIRVCGHKYHKNCIEQWIRTHSSCPMCRAYIYGINNSTNTMISPSTSTLVSPSTISSLSTGVNLSPSSYDYWGIDPPMYPL